MEAIKLKSGEAAEIVDINGDWIALLANRAYPPGTPLSGDSPELGPLEIKVRTCRRQPSNAGARFRVEGKLVNLSRLQRDKLNQR